MSGKSARDRIRTDPRLRRRRMDVERARRRRIAGWFTALVVTAGLVWVAFFSPLLDVTRVRLVGSNHTSLDDVALATGVVGDNLLLVSTGAVEERVMELPWVAAASADRILPDTLRVTIKERRAALVIEAAHGSWTVDSRGRVLQRGHGSESLPVLQATVTESLTPGDRVTDDGARAVLRVWRSLAPKLRARIVALFAPTPERISFSLSDRTLIRYGAARMLVSKNRVLKALLARLRRQGRQAAYIDVRVPSNPAIAPAAATPTPTPTPSV